MRDPPPPLDPGGARWVAPLTATGPVVARSVAFAGDDVIVAGEFAGTLAIGEIRVRASAGRDGFVARLDSGGKPRWVKTFGGAGDDRVNGVAVAGSGSIAIGGEIATAIGEASAVGRPDGFVAGLSATGELEWSGALGATRYAGITSVAVTSEGAVIAAGQFAGSMPSGAGEIYSAGNQDLLIARYSSAGALAWIRRAGGPGSDTAAAIAIGTGDTMAFAGTVMDGATFGGPELETVGEAPDAVVGRVNGAGEFTWVKQLGGAGHDSAAAIAFAGDELVAVGRFARELTGAGPTLASSGSTDGFVVRFSLAGAPGRSLTVGGQAADWLAAVGGGDGVVIGGGFAGTASGALKSAGGIDGLVGKLAGSQTRWQRGVGGPGDDAVTAVAVGPRGVVAAAGSFAGPLAIDGNRLDPGGEIAAFVALLEP